MRNLKKTYVVIAMTLGLGSVAATSLASSVNLGTISTDPLNPTTTEISHPYDPNGFTDDISFFLAAPSTLNISLGQTIKTLFGPVTTISSLNGTLFDSTNLNFGTIPGDGNLYSFSSLATGSYLFEVSGVALGSKGGIVNFGAFTTPSGEPSPVPEPETYAMLLAGLGLLSYIARRRNAEKPD